ncbi:hypothetical protein ACQQ2T_05000 [Paraclostridium tenue]
MSKEILKYIPGFRSDKKIKKIIASIYYLFCVLMMFMANSIGEIFLSIMMMIIFALACAIIDLLTKKEKRNLKSVGFNIGLPFVAVIVCSIFVANTKLYDPKQEAAKELGISLSKYNSVVDEYNTMLEDYDKLKKDEENNKLNYENNQKEYSNLETEFEKYKKEISESTVKELESLKKDNENYKNKVSDLEGKVSELKSKLK